MLIGICGAKCAGKRTVAQYLVEHHGFKKLHIEQRKPGQAQGGIPLEPGVNGVQAASECDTNSTEGTASAHALRPKNAAARPSHTFASEGDLLDFVTKHWRSRWVTTDIHSEAVLDALSRRPFFILISVDAPVTVRWRRHQTRQSQLSASSREPIISLEDFVAESDAHLYDADGGVQEPASPQAVAGALRHQGRDRQVGDPRGAHVHGRAGPDRAHGHGDFEAGCPPVAVWRVGFDDDGQILGSVGDEGKLMCYRQMPSGAWAKSSELGMMKARWTTPA
ncbi:hypothetical protein EKO27_g11726 [Xylaria grammica]|uniref:Uncharacterized protein n=1 Tax=Xylaria grammica TaxID=363999 RepID=A0A439CMJ2_9PEZI|nr:hypothetical protein EKO27_g11726 [Xylaria grammica]